VRVETPERLRYSVRFGGELLVDRATLSLDVDRSVLGVAPKLRSRRPRASTACRRPVPRRSAKIAERYAELRLEMQGRYAVVFRAYDDGVAYRFETSLPQASVKVYAEKPASRSRAPGTLLPEGRRLHVAQRAEVPLPAAQGHPEGHARLAAGRRRRAARDQGRRGGVGRRGLPGAVAGRYRQARSRRDLPGLSARGEEGAGPRHQGVRRADYLAETRGTRSYPWRILGIASKDADLLTSSLVYLLARPFRDRGHLVDPAGKVAWDWWNAWNLHGVPSIRRQHRHLQALRRLRAKNKIEYVILDEGWYELGDVLKVVPALDMEKLLAYAREKNVGIILWVVWKTLEDQLEAALDRYRAGA
jgi:alpha-glucosidase